MHWANCRKSYIRKHCRSVFEAYDISNISGTDNVGVMVAFENAQKLSSALRKFKIKSVEGQNDIGSMTEVLQRRLAHAQEEIENETQSPKFLPLPRLSLWTAGSRTSAI
jgi:excinuclease ABC subunit C